MGIKSTNLCGSCRTQVDLGEHMPIECRVSKELCCSVNNWIIELGIENSHLQCRHLIPALNAWADRAQYTTANPIAKQFPGYGCMDDLTTESSFYSQATWVVMCLVYFFDMLSLGVCTTRHWQTSGQLVQNKMSGLYLMEES